MLDPESAAMIRWLFASVHLLALGIGLGAVWARARGLRGPLDVPGLRRVFAADTWWGIAAVLWIGTGLVRAFGELEKRSAWRIRAGRGETIDARGAPALAGISTAQAGPR